jgi:ribonucleoside-diphosphate reductase alpha chain
MLSETRPSKVGKWTEPALRVLRERYLTRKDGEVVETPEEMCWRVALAIAAGEARYGRSQAAVREIAEAFYEIMTDNSFLPNSPTLMNAGKDNGLQYSACYVLPIGDSMEEIFDSVKAAAIIHKSGGGCIAGDARVWTTFCGLEPIEVLFNRATADSRGGEQHGAGVAFDVGDLDIRTVAMDPATGLTGLRRVSHVWRFDVPAESQIVVRTREGTEVQTSVWHPFMVLRPQGLVALRADELTPGDVILGPDRPDDYWPYRDSRHVGSLVIDERLGWLLGFTLGDGSFGYVPSLRQHRLRWFSGERDVLERVCAILAEQGIHVSIQRDARGLLSVSTLTQRFVHDMLEASGLQKIGPKDDRIRIPEIIAKSPLAVVRAFVAGLVDSDGYVAPDGSPSYATASGQMAEDLAGLISLLGYQPSVKAKPPYGKGRRTIYQVQLCALPQVNELRSSITQYMASVHKVARLSSKSRKQTALRLPFRPWRDRLKSLGLVGTQRRGAGPCGAELSRWSCNQNGRCRRDDLQAIAAAVATHNADLSELLYSAARRGLEIASVSRAPAPKPFYDLSVEGWNTYAAGTHGMAFVHNTGFAFSRLRPKDDIVKSTGGRASGPVSFLRVFNGATEAVKQGGTRRGANMGILKVDHPDILEFIECKLDGGITNFNISVAATDAFMDALEKGEEYDLVNPHTGKTTERLWAREVFDRIVRAAWRTGDPGMVFIDRINKSPANPTPEMGMIEATNPCGEQPLLPNEACNLGSLNVAKFARRAESGEWSVDWDEMERVVRLAVRFLDDVIEMNPYPLPEIDATVKANRRVGLGIMGWADLLFMLGTPYDSDEAVELGGRLMAFVNEKAHDQSTKLAEERGPFPNWSHSIYKSGRPMRNSTVTTIAPTGTISMIAGCSSGIEPIFALAFEHRVKQSDGERVLTFVNETFERLARDGGFFSDALMAEIARRGTLHDIPGVPAGAERVFRTAHDIGFEWHVRHQAAFQKSTDNGVSKTINLPNDASEAEVAHAYQLAWELGCLGITVFRDGCKGEQVLNIGVGAKKDKAEATAPAVPSGPIVIKPRPHSLTGTTYRIGTPIGTAFITVNATPDGDPFEVFLQVGKGGSDTMAVAEALGRLISLVLRMPSPLGTQRRLEEVISQLSRIGGGQPMGFGPGKILSLPDAIARTLAEHIGQVKNPEGAAQLPVAGKKSVGDLCKECGQATFIYEEGCKKCLSCGFNEC